MKKIYFSPQISEYQLTLTTTLCASGGNPNDKIEQGGNLLGGGAPARKSAPTDI